MKNVCTCLAAILLAMIPHISADCGLYDQFVIRTSDFHSRKEEGENGAFHIGDDSEDGDYTWKIKVEDPFKFENKCPDVAQYPKDGYFQKPTNSSKVNFASLTALVRRGSKCFGRYEIERERRLNDETTSKRFTVLFINQEEKARKRSDPYYSFTKNVIRKLLKHQYYYLHMSHFFKGADNYFPNVAKFFRGYVDRALQMAENGIKYTLAKRETLSLMHGISDEERRKTEAVRQENDTSLYHWPMYDLFHYYHKNAKGSVFPKDLNLESERFFLGSDNDVTDDGYLQEAFRQAVHWEKTLMGELATVSMLAGNICDSELEEYVSAEMMPDQRKTIKLLESHHQTLKKMGNTRVANFLFDSQL